MLVSTSIEYTLGQYLTVFLKHRNPTHPFASASADRFADATFNDKITLLETLCDENKTNKERRIRLLNALREIKKIRNKIGHWGASYDPESDNFRLKDRRLKKPSKEHLDASKAVKVVNKDYSIAYRGLSELYNEIFFPESTTEPAPEKH